MYRSIFNRGVTGYEFRGKASGGDEPSEVFLYDEIGSPGGFWGIDPAAFVKDLKSISGDVVIRINSPGGSVFGGMAIFNAIKDFKGSTTVIVDGLAASAASYIALAGDRVLINEGAFFMIHDAWSCMCGNATDFQKEADILGKLDSQIAGFYARRTGKDADEVRQAMSAETWFTADEALEWGLVDEVLKQEKPAENKFDLSVYNNVPDSLLKATAGETPKPRDLETALRDAGLSRREAKAVLSDGLKALKPNPPDEDEDIELWAALKKIQIQIERTIQ